VPFKIQKTPAFVIVAYSFQVYLSKT